MSQDTSNKTAQKIEETDIFEWFKADDELRKEVEQFDQINKKDIYDTLGRIWDICKVLNLVALCIVLLFMGYIYIQNNPDLKNSQFIDPLCPILLGEAQWNDSSCSSVAAKLAQVQKIYAQDQINLFDGIVDMIEPLYSTIDFLHSGEVSFLLDKTDTRLKPFDILEEFDRLKNEFETQDKTALSCYDIIIRDDLLTLTCDAYSSDWDSVIRLPNGETSSRIGGTAISRATSFIDFIEQESETLNIIEKQKYFSLQSVSWENLWYTKKTTFSLQLQYAKNALPL